MKYYNPLYINTMNNTTDQFDTNIINYENNQIDTVNDRSEKMTEKQSDNLIIC